MSLLLAALQLRWSAKVSEAEQDRLQRNLQLKISGLQQEFAQDLLEVSEALQASETREPGMLIARLSDRYMVWRRISGYTPLISNLYILRGNEVEPAALLRLNVQTQRLERTNTGASLLTFSMQDQALLKAQSDNDKLWSWDDRIPGLVHPIYAERKTQQAGPAPLFGYLVVVFDDLDLEKNYIPSLARKYFPLGSNFAFQLVQQNGGGNNRILSHSGENSAVIFQHVDAAVPLLNGSNRYGTSAASSAEELTTAMLSRPTLISATRRSRWSLLVRHRSGSLEAAVDGLRRRNLAVSVLVLATLLVSLLTILSATRRARRLAWMQMEFASGVSHELRTPLSVINAAAENLADGVVVEADRIRSYGELIHQESQRLNGMVEHILDFAHLGSGRHHHRLESVAIEAVLDRVLQNERSAIEGAGIALKVVIEPALPSLRTDILALQQCVGNLLSNARKYAAGGKQIIVSAHHARIARQDWILISVEDFGAGLSSAEIPDIFDPFYRGSNARGSLVRGTGLGLSITRKLIEALGGRVSVASSPGHGSVFTLQVPAATGSNPTHAGVHAS